MYTLKSIARRSIALGMAVALFAATIVPAAPVFADDLNPLTDRSLTLTSGSPGWAFTDGSGNSTYAPPNSGANGQKTGNTFDFKVSSAATVKGFSFQYCTTSAGSCYGPGDNGCSSGTTGGGDCVRKTNAQALATDDQTSDLEVVAPSTGEAAFGTYVTDTSSTTNPNGMVSSIPAPGSANSNFMVYYLDGTTWEPSTGWTMAASNEQDGTQGLGQDTNKNNYISLTNSTGEEFTAGQRIKVVFFGKDANYITNPGSEEFFVKINTWNTEVTSNWTPGNMTYNIDGGVTVANVMNESIQITTKVLETMDFSVGTVDPYTLEALEDDPGTVGDNEAQDSQLYAANGSETHAVCAPILKGMLPTDKPNVLNMGDTGAENSLKTDTTYSTHSYWRLSSNSSAGATVYYSGVTLSNTVGDKIDPIYNTTPGDGEAHAPQVGMEQFGLALANGSIASNPQPGDPLLGTNVHNVAYASEKDGGKVYEQAADDTAAGVLTYGSQGIHGSVTDNDVSNLDANPSWHSPRLYPLIPGEHYDRGAGIVNTGVNGYGTINTAFAFDETSNTIPVGIATQDTQVVDCVTGKMRYIANIAATTPAGIYTTKINYIAAPQY